MDVLNKILDEIGLGFDDTWSKRSKFTYALVLQEMALYPSTKECAKALGITEHALEHIINRNIKILFPDKPYKVKWNNYLLSFSKYKWCNSCTEILPITEFVTDSNNWDKLSYRCKQCKQLDREIFTENNPEYNKTSYQEHRDEYITRAIQYNTKRALATPPWANLSKIKEIYNTCPEGYHVDHIIPLQGDIVCGLHVETNLQHLPALENLRKSNKWELI